MVSNCHNRFNHIFQNTIIFAIARGTLLVTSLLTLEHYSFYSLKAILGEWFVVYVFILSDLSVYWWHRMNHRLSFLWRFHQVHHADTFLDFSTALRFHFGELTLSYFVRTSIYLLLGFELKEVLLYNTALTAANLFHHSNISLPQKFESLLSRFIVTPKFHRTHHSLYLAHTNSNYSALWVGWDKLFGSYSGIQSTDIVGLPYVRDPRLKMDFLLPFQTLKKWPEAFKGTP